MLSFLVGKILALVLRGNAENSFCMFIREHFVVMLLRYFHQFKDINSSDLQVLFISN